MAKQLNVNLAFTADTSKAKQQLQDLQRTLESLSIKTAQSSPLGITDEISKAIIDVSKLEAALKNSTSQTGKLDLGQFRQELNKAGLSAQKISSQLSALGPEGAKAFSQLTQSIMNAELPLRRTNTLLNSFATTLKNTAKWQISSSILHGFVGSVQTAYYYAQDLNESLNNIRIVTGKSTEEMAAFAEQANEAAKALSTTTTNYTDAALIYYQQGLNDEDVAARTDTTIKLANVARQSAEDVSQQMTAIWNNFYDGSKSLEYYADVITALGAATASSSAEITEGLEKFAAIADTVGLSYEYATAALATVTATTRQSADIVGNAFKTIFARLEGLNLGETLDDGTTLNKYSEALAKVGISIKDVSGEMKDADEIIADMMQKWDTLSKDQQLALAQTVAGVRQYTQLIALMENQDFFKQNLTVAQGSEGSLQKQADIYAESWEAAKDQVVVSLEDIYNEIFDDKLFIGLTNAFAKLTKEVGNIVEAFGGLAGMLPFVSSMILKMFGEEIVNSLDNFVYHLKMSTEEGKRSILKIRKEFSQQLINMASDELSLGSGAAEVYTKQAELQNILINKTSELNDANKSLTEQEQLQVDLLLDKVNILKEQTIETSKARDDLEAETNLLIREITRIGANEIYDSHGTGTYDETHLKQTLDTIKEIQVAYTEADTLREEFYKATEVYDIDGDEKLYTDALKKIIEELDNMTPLTEKANNQVKNLRTALEILSETGGKKVREVNDAFQLLENELSKISGDELQDLRNGLSSDSKAFDLLTRKINELERKMSELGKANAKAAIEMAGYKKTIADASRQINSFNGGATTLTQQFVQFGNTLSSLGMAISSIKGIFNTLNNDSLSLSEKIGDLIISFGMFTTTGIRSFKLLGETVDNFINIIDRAKLSILADITAENIHNGTLAAKGGLLEFITDLEAKHGLTLKALNAEILASIKAKGLEIGVGNEQIIQETIKQELEKKEIFIKDEIIAAYYAEILVKLKDITITEALNRAISKLIAKIILLIETYGMFIPPLMMIISLVGIVTSAFKIYNEHLQKTASIEAARAKELKEEQDTLIETKNNIDSLTESYRELTAEVKTNSDFNSDLRTQVFDLCNQYGLYDLALKALIEDYDDLNDTINKTAIEKDKQIIDTSFRTQMQTRSAISDNIWAELEGTQRDQLLQGIKTIDLGAFIDSDLMDVFDKYNIEYELGGIGGHISLEDFVRVATKNNEEFVKALESNGSEQAKTLLDIINKHQELFDIYLDSEEQYTEAVRDKSIRQNSDNINSLKEYQSAVNAIADEIEDTFSGDDAREQAEKFAQTSLSEINKNYNKLSKRYLLAESLSESLELSKDEIVKQLEDMTDAEIAFLAKFPQLIKDPKNIKDTLDSFSDIVDLLNKQEYRVNIIGVLQDISANNGVVSDEIVSNLYENTDFEQQTGFSKEQFSGMEQDVQTANLLSYYGLTDEQIREDAENAVKEFEDAISDIEDKYAELEQAIPDEPIKILNFDIASEESIAEEDLEELNKLTEKYVKDKDSLTEEEIATLTNYYDKYEGIQEKIEQNEKDYSKDQEDRIKLAEYGSKKLALEQAKNANSTKATYEEMAKEARTALSTVSSNIDSLQSAYNNLTSVVKDYNKQGYLTLDNLQLLLDMDSKYLQALEWENGQMSINETVLKEITLAKLDAAEADAYAAAMAELKALQEANAGEAESNTVIATQALKAAVDAANASAAEGIAIWNNYWNSVTQGYSGVSQADKDRIGNSLKDQLAAIENVRQNIISGKVSFGKIAGSGSSSGGSSKDKKILEDEIDRYYDLNNAIQTVNNSLEEYKTLLDKLKTYQDHYQGRTLIKSLQVQNELIKKQSDLLNKQIENYKAYYKEQSRELDELKTKITSYGGVFEGDILTNYTQVITDAVNAYNSALDDNAEKQYEKIKEALSRYQELLYTDMAETEQNIADTLQEQLENQFSIIENNLKGFETEVQLKLDMTDFNRTWRDFIKTVEQDFRKVYKNLKIESAASTDNFRNYLQDAQTRMQEIYEVEAEIRKMEASKDENGVVQIDETMLFGSISEAQEKLKELQKELIENGNNLQQLYEQVWDTYIDGLDQASDGFADITKEVEHLTNMLEYEKEIIELLYGDEAFDLMSQYYTVQQGNIEAQIYSTRVQAEFWEEQFYKAFNMNKDKHNVDLEDMSTWTEDMRKAYDEMIESQETLNELIIKGIENFRDYYVNNIAETLREMDKAIWGMKLDELKEDWDFIQKRADEYLDDVEGAYKIQTLANKIDQSIAETTDLKYQQKLAKLREDEITMLREKERLTQADIDLAEARYNIALKEMALEEAQNSKTDMKLVRDTSGNWTYQYVANDEDVLNKQQELLDAYNELYKIADEAYKHAMELAMEMYEEYKDKVKEIAEDITLSEEEKMVKIKELQDQYLPEIQAAMENAKIYEQETIMAAAATFAEVCEQDADAYTTLTDLQKELVDEVKEQHLEDYEEIREAILNNYDEISMKAKESFQEMNENSKTAAADVIRQWDKNTNDSVKGAMHEAYNALEDYTREFENELINLERISGIAIVEPGGVARDIDEISSSIEDVIDKTDELAEQGSKNLDTLRGFVNQVESAFDGVIGKINNTISGMREYLSLMESVAGMSVPSLPRDTGNGSDNSGNNSGSGSGSSGTPYTPPYNTKEKSKGLAVLDGYTVYTDPSGASDTIAISRYGEIQTIIGYDGTETDKTKKVHNYFTDRNYSAYGATFASGGYTGEWGTNGRLAVLHQKELVLNEDDTSNMLSAVRAIRDIAGLNESISQTIASSIGQLIMRTVAAGGGNFNSGTNNNTSNVFNITAEFPNADDVQTIRDAILSLPNLASQFVNER